MLHWLLGTQQDVAGLVLRLILAAVIFPHGAQKALGWYGGHGFAGTMQYFTKSLGIPAPVGVIGIATEFLGPLFLTVGLFSRLVAAGIAVMMITAAVRVHRPNGFFMNWFGNQQGEGFEYHLLAAGIALAIVLNGAGAWSLDGLLAR